MLGFLLRLCASGFLLMTMWISEAVGVVVEAGLDDMNTFTFYAYLVQQPSMKIVKYLFDFLILRSTINNAGIEYYTY